jgi:hypothetical protein
MSKEKIGNIYKGITFKDKLARCPFEFCTCPLKAFVPNLYECALMSATFNRMDKDEI